MHTTPLSLLVPTGRTEPVAGGCPRTPLMRSVVWAALRTVLQAWRRQLRDAIRH